MNYRSYCDLPKAFIILSLSVIAFTLSAQPAIILDTLDVVDELQGTIGYHIEMNYYMGGVSPSSVTSLYTGDSYDYFDYCNVSSRSYLSFLITTVPTGYHIENVNLYIYQRWCCGNEGSDTFPLFYDSHDYFCHIAKVDYGYSLELGDFWTPVLTDAGVISNNAENGWKSLDITNAYTSCVMAGNQYCQLMFYFQIVSDYDYCEDAIYFNNAHYIGYKPRIEIIYESNTSATDITVTQCAIDIYPNPCHDEVTVSTKAPSQILTVQLYNLKGQIIKTINPTSINSDAINLQFDQDLKPGLYLLRYTTQSVGKLNTGTRKLLIK